MKANLKNKVVTYLIQNMALICLAETETDKPLRAAAEAHRRKLFTELSPEDRAPILLMRDTMIKLAQKLASCESIDTLMACEHLMNELIAGRVMITQEIDPDKAADNDLTPI